MLTAHITTIKKLSPCNGVVFMVNAQLKLGERPPLTDSGHRATPPSKSATFLTRRASVGMSFHADLQKPPQDLFIFHFDLLMMRASCHFVAQVGIDMTKPSRKSRL